MALLRRAALHYCWLLLATPATALASPSKRSAGFAAGPGLRPATKSVQGQLKQHQAPSSA